MFRCFNFYKLNDIFNCDIYVLLVLVVIAWEVGVKRCWVFTGSGGQKLVQVWSLPAHRVVCDQEHVAYKGILQ
jgi:hypothetical protein